MKGIACSTFKSSVIARVPEKRPHSPSAWKRTGVTHVTAVRNSPLHAGRDCLFTGHVHVHECLSHIRKHLKMKEAAVMSVPAGGRRFQERCLSWRFSVHFQQHRDWRANAGLLGEGGSVHFPRTVPGCGEGLRLLTNGLPHG